MSTHVYAGIPTMYRGIRFRSRLEARWARFFDALRWGWAYEPFDLAAYIPDFVLALDDGELLVEAKPTLSLAELDQHRGKIEASGWRCEALIVGADLFESEHVHPVVGIIGEREEGPDGRSWLWSPARLFGCENCSRPSLLAESGSWRCRVCGAEEGHLGTLTRARQAWSDAANAVQWRAS